MEKTIMRLLIRETRYTNFIDAGIWRNNGWLNFYVAFGERFHIGRCNGEWWMWEYK